MATKTAVCPDCGSPAAPGRYACPDCGALLASVAAGARSWRSSDAGARAVASDTASAPLTVERASANGSGLDAEPEPAPAEATTLPGSFAEDAVPLEPPSGSATDPTEPVITPRVDLAPPTATAWPPAGAAEPVSSALPRTPAGAWLPPSAVLDGLAVAAVAAPASFPAGSSGVRSFRLWSLTDSLAIPADGPRRVVVAGATVAAIGFLLPWANVLAGAGLIGGYFTQWGLAGPGHWIVLVVLGGLAIVAGSGPRSARGAVGLGAVAGATLLVGLLWPYLFGVLGRSVGVWVVLAGAVVLLLGGALDRLARHGAERPAVQ